MAGRVLRARSIEPFERSRPWFAVDADTMQIQLWEGAVPSCAGTVRERTAAGTEREESGLGAQFSRKNGSRNWKGAVCRRAGHRDTERADARKGFVLERVVSCGSGGESRRRTKLDFGSCKSFDDQHRSTTLGAESRDGGVTGGR